MLQMYTYILIFKTQKLHCNIPRETVSQISFYWIKKFILLPLYISFSILVHIAIFISSLSAIVSVNCPISKVGTTLDTSRREGFKCKGFVQRYWKGWRSKRRKGGVCGGVQGRRVFLLKGRKAAFGLEPRSLHLQICTYR